MAEILVRELLNFRVKISDLGHDTYNAWRESEHDDLVLAVAIAAWVAELVIASGAWLRSNPSWCAVRPKSTSARSKIRQCRGAPQPSIFGPTLYN
jgi:hypothetical protein